MIFTRYLVSAVALAAVVSLSSCSSAPEVREDDSLATRAFWKGAGVEGSPKIVIDLSAQRLRYYKGGQLVGVTPISSGKEGTSTRNGHFTVLEKDIDHRSSVFGAFVDENNNIVQSDVDLRKDSPPAGTKFLGASMRYCMRIVGGFCMHEGYLPGYPASHGCVRLPTRMAQILFDETPVGTPVEIVGHGSLAGIEEEVPLGHGEVATDEPDDDEGKAEGDREKPKKRESVRRAEVADADTGGDMSHSGRYQTARSLKQKYKKQKGSTWYLE